MQHMQVQMPPPPPPHMQHGGFFNHQNRGVAAAWCPEGDAASSALYLPPQQQHQRRQQHVVAPAPPVAPPQQQQQQAQQQPHQELTAALGLLTAPGRTRQGATLYVHAATGLRFEAAPSGGENGAGDVLYTPVELGMLASSLPVYMRQEVAVAARDWPAFYGKVLQAVGAGAKAAARAQQAQAQAGQ